jgi:hypothetical protein
MAFDSRPTTVFPGYTFDNDTLHIPLSALPTLKAEDADPETGDSRQVLHAINATTYKWLKELNEEDRSTKLTIQKFYGVSPDDNFVDGYSWNFNCCVSSRVVADEPAP